MNKPVFVSLSNAQALVDYAAWTQTVWSTQDKPLDNRDYAIMSLGLCGESGELQEAILCNDPRETVVKEFGDCIYYWARIVDAFQIELIANSSAEYGKSMLKAPKGFDEQLLHVATKLSEVFKKFIRGDAQTDPLFNQYMSDYFWIIQKLLEICGITLEEVLQKNKAKLIDRISRNVLRGSGNDR